MTVETSHHPAGESARAPGTTSHWDRFGWLMALVWLIFLIYPAIALVQSTADPGWVVVAWAGLGVFIVLYIVGFTRGIGAGALGRRPKPGQWVLFAGLIVCAGLSVPAEGGAALGFLPFILSFASYGLTRLAHWVTFTGSAIACLMWVLLARDGARALTILIIVLLLGVINTVTTRLIIRSAEAERLSLELAGSEGREGVARDVHDLIGHSLTVVRLKAQLAARLIEQDPDRARAELIEIADLAAEAISGVRATVAGARAASLAEQLQASTDAMQAAGIATRLEGDPGALSPAQGITASWILREATTNILRHAAATTVTITARPGVFSVRDDGVGGRIREGNGVRGMRERAAAAGARFGLSSPVEGGTRVEVTW